MGWSCIEPPATWHWLDAAPRQRIHNRIGSLLSDLKGRSESEATHVWQRDGRAYGCARGRGLDRFGGWAPRWRYAALSLSQSGSGPTVCQARVAASFVASSSPANFSSISTNDAQSTASVSRIVLAFALGATSPLASHRGALDAVLLAGDWVAGRSLPSAAQTYCPEPAYA